MRRYEECRDLREGMHAGSLQPHETVLSRLTGVQSKRIKDQLEIEMMTGNTAGIAVLLPLSQSQGPLSGCAQAPFLPVATNDGTLRIQLLK